MLTITNTQPGPRGVNTVSGPILLDPGQTLEKVKVYKREKEHIEATGWFDIDGSYDADPAPVARAAEPSGDANAANIASLTEQVSNLTALLTAAMSRPGSAEPAPSAQTKVLSAKHAGGGSWFVYDGDQKIGEAMPKEDAEAFNALSDEDKAAYLAKA